MTDIELAYAAGIIDGEGTIGIYSHTAASRSPRKPRKIPVLRICLSVPQCDIRLPEWFRAKFGCGYVHNAGIPKSGRRVVWCWKAWGFKQCVPILEALLPYLYLKRDRAEIALAFARQNKNIRHLPQIEKDIEVAKRNALVLQLKECNRRGIVPPETKRSGTEKSCDSPICKETNLQSPLEIGGPRESGVTN